MKKIILKLKSFPKEKYYKIFFWVFIAVLTIIFHNQHILNSDEGVLLNGAWQMINGSILYLDIFSYVAPLGFYLIYWLWLLFGISYLSANLFSIIVLITTAIILFKSSQLIKKRNLNYLVPFLFIFATAWIPLINHNFFSTFFAVISTYFFLKYINNKRSFYIILSALFISITVLTLQQKGLALVGATAVSFLLFIKLNLKKKIKHLNLSFLFFLLPLLFLLKWPLDLIIDNLIYFPFFNYTEANSIPLTAWFTITTIFIIIVIKFFKIKRKKIYYLLLLQLLLLLSVLTLPDPYHILLSSFPLFILIPELVSFKNTKSIKNKIYYIAILSLLSILTLLTIVNNNLVFDSDKKDRDNIKRLVDNNCDSDYIYTGPFIPNLYFELRKINPSPYDILLSNHHTKKQFQKAKEKIIEKNPDCAILFYPSNLERFKYNKNNVVDTYIRENYKLISNEFGVDLYKKTSN